jgi:hypothetical protein
MAIARKISGNWIRKPLARSTRNFTVRIVVTTAAPPFNHQPNAA